MSKFRWIIMSALVALCAGNAHAARYAEVEGTISAVNLTAPATVTLTDGADSVILKVVPSTVIVVEEQGRVSLADLTVGSAAEAKFDANTLVAKQIKVAAGEDEEEDAEAVGVVVDADPATGLVMIDTNNDTTADLTLSTTAQTRIKVGGVLITQAELDALDGLTVHVEYGSTSFVATKIEAEELDLEVNGTVTAVDPTAGTLTIDTATGPMTFTVASSADIRLGGKKIALPAVQIGDLVEVHYTTNGTTNIALKVSVRKPKPLHVVGTVTAVDAVAGTSTVTSRGTTLVLTLTPSTDLRINGRRMTLADVQAALTAGSNVTVSASYFTRAAVNEATVVQLNVKSRGHGRG